MAQPLGRVAAGSGQGQPATRQGPSAGPSRDGSRWPKGAGLAGKSVVMGPVSGLHRTPTVDFCSRHIWSLSPHSRASWSWRASIACQAGLRSGDPSQQCSRPWLARQGSSAPGLARRWWPDERPSSREIPMSPSFKRFQAPSRAGCGGVGPHQRSASWAGKGQPHRGPSTAANWH